MLYTYCKKDFELAQKFVSVVLTMDRLYREGCDESEASFSKEGIVPVILSDTLKYDDLGSWENAKMVLKDVYNGYKTIENDIRKNYMFEQVSSVLMMGEWLFENRGFTYRQLVAGMLYVDHNPITKNMIAHDINQLDNLLRDKGYKGSYEDRLRSWKQDNVVAPDDLQGVLDELAQKAKEKAVNLGFEEISDVDVKCVVEHDAPYSGYCDFLTRTIYINGDMEYTYPGLKHLICHETHPGHMTHMQVRKTLAEKGQVPVDALLVITNTASSGIFEGLADNGLNFLGWIENKDDVIARLYQNLNSKMSVTIAHMLHEENAEVEKVKQYYQKTLLATDAAVNSKIRFLTYPFRRPFTYCYWRGNEAVEKIYDRIPKPRAYEFLRYAYNNMQSINTANQFV